MDDQRAVVVTDFDMPFGRMVVFILKWTLASIPALLLLALVGLGIGAEMSRRWARAATARADSVTTQANAAREEFEAQMRESVAAAERAAAASRSAEPYVYRGQASTSEPRQKAPPRGTYLGQATTRMYYPSDSNCWRGVLDASTAPRFTSREEAQSAGYSLAPACDQ